MAIFGAPHDRSRPLFARDKTALAMQAGVAALSARRVAEGKDAITIGIGISAGEAVAGTVAQKPNGVHRYRRQGEPAARLESTPNRGRS